MSNDDKPTVGIVVPAHGSGRPRRAGRTTRPYIDWCPHSTYNPKGCGACQPIARGIRALEAIQVWAAAEHTDHCETDHCSADAPCSGCEADEMLMQIAAENKRAARKS